MASVECLTHPGQYLVVEAEPAEQGTGVGTALMAAMMERARRGGVRVLWAHGRDTALDFFTKRGFTAQQRNTVRRGGEWLTNTTMEKKLTKEAAA